jgi:hypothetical protein
VADVSDHEKIIENLAQEALVLTDRDTLAALGRPVEAGREYEETTQDWDRTANRRGLNAQVSPVFRVMDAADYALAESEADRLVLARENERLKQCPGISTPFGRKSLPDSPPARPRRPQMPDRTEAAREAWDEWEVLWSEKPLWEVGREYIAALTTDRDAERERADRLANATTLDVMDLNERVIHAEDKADREEQTREQAEEGWKGALGMCRREKALRRQAEADRDEAVHLLYSKSLGSQRWTAKRTALMRTITARPAPGPEEADHG